MREAKSEVQKRIDQILSKPLTLGSERKVLNLIRARDLEIKQAAAVEGKDA